MNYLLKKISTPLLLLTILGGCTMVADGPKFLWGANVQRRANEMGRVCLGESGLAHIANPITWFFTPPHSYWFAKSDQVQEQEYLHGIWVVQSYGVSFEEDQWVSLFLIDINEERVAYLGNVENESKQEIAKRFDNPDWDDLKDLKNDSWIGNAIEWIKDGKPTSANYCD